MAEKDSKRIKSGGRRLPLYAELGRYFSPNGDFLEPEFRTIARDSLGDLKAQGPADGFEERAGEWLSQYLERVLGYLEEKDMGSAAFLVFQAAMDESARMGISRVAVSPDRLRLVLSRAAAPVGAAPEKKRAPDEKKDLIFKAALDIFSARGFYEATMEDIAARAKVAKGTVYRIFQSKEDLLDKLLANKSQEIVDRFTEIFSREGGVLGQIQEAIEAYLDFIERNHALYRLIQSEAMVRRSGSRTMFYDYLISNLPMIKERIVSLNQKGELKTTSFYTVWYGMLGFIDGVVHKWFRSGMDGPLKDETPVILEVLFNGFVGEKSSGKRFFVPPEETDPKARSITPGPGRPPSK